MLFPETERNKGHFLRHSARPCWSLEWNVAPESSYLMHLSTPLFYNLGGQFEISSETNFKLKLIKAKLLSHASQPMDRGSLGDVQVNIRQPRVQIFIKHYL